MLDLSLTDITKLQIPTLGDLVGFVDNRYLNGALRGQWTIWDHETQKQICAFDTFIGYQYREGSEVPAQNIEKGSFAQYNKINNPAEAGVRLAKSGYPGELETFLNYLQMYKRSTKLVDVVLPYEVLLSYNITDISHGKSEGDSTSLLIVDLSLKEIREEEGAYAETRALSYKKVKNPADASTQDRGRQQAKQPSTLYNLGL